MRISVHLIAHGRAHKCNDRAPLIYQPCCAMSKAARGPCPYTHSRARPRCPLCCFCLFIWHGRVPCSHDRARYLGADLVQFYFDLVQFYVPIWYNLMFRFSANLCCSSCYKLRNHQTCKLSLNLGNSL